MRQFYDLVDQDGIEAEVFFSREELKDFLAENPTVKRVFKMPVINTGNSATYVDGHAPESRKEAIRIEKELAALRVQEYGTRPDKRGEIKKEIAKVKAKRKAPLEPNKGGRG